MHLDDFYSYLMHLVASSRSVFCVIGTLRSNFLLHKKIPQHISSWSNFRLLFIFLFIFSLNKKNDNPSATVFITVPSKLHTCYILTESFYNLAFAFVEPGHLATTLLSAFCFANVCLPTLSFGNASIPHSTCGDSRSSQLFGQALTRLVAVSCVHCCTSTPALSTSSSSRGFTSFEWDISS